MNVEIGRQNIIFCFGNNGAAQFHLWESINRNQTFILDSYPLFAVHYIYCIFHVVFAIYRVVAWVMKDKTVA